MSGDPAHPPSAPIGAASQPRRTAQRWRDWAVVLPVLGTALLIPPLVSLPLGMAPVAGVPAVVLYVFGVWAVLILATLRITTGLCREPQAPQPPAQPPAQPPPHGLQSLPTDADPGAPRP